MDTTAQWQHHEGAGFMKGNINMGAEIMGSNMNNIACTTNKPGEVEKKARPQEQLNCPRCNSTNTKFCYYNNYSLTQPRYFCKTCRRYWTEGGTLRNVPVGGGSRKNKKPSSTSTSSCSSSMLSKNSNSNIPDLNPPLTNLSNISHQAGQDLNLAFPDYSKFQYLMPTKIENDNSHHQNPRFASSSPLMSFIAANPGGGPAGGHFEAPGSNTAATFSSGFQFQEFKPSTVGFRAQDNINGGNIGGRISLFPNEVDHHHQQQQHKGQGNNPTGYWSGLLGGGSW